ncbi:hypothetical protein bcgnr5382_16660 [Bacillus cereus]|uniref:hypothetical protein n=1 Tax=Bacillus cereus TaxID=1396 RepID=UPI0009952768|nr:hypothetical protein [Bacillus cereus]OOZ87911.1 hypothetical protein BHL49_19350 [Bacillus cereus]
MDNKMKYLSTPAILFSFLGFIFAVASFLTLTNSFSGIAVNVIFWGSIVTTSAAVIVPLLSFKKFKLDSYRIKLYSLIFGFIIMIMLLILDSYGMGMILELKKFANKGLIWGLNTAILLFNLTYLEIENNDLKNQEQIKSFLKKEEELKEEKRKRAHDKQKLIESQREVLELKREMLKMKKQQSSKGDGE